jgi:hypothetical protein
MRCGSQQWNDLPGCSSLKPHGHQTPSGDQVARREVYHRRGLEYKFSLLSPWINVTMASVSVCIPVHTTLHIDHPRTPIPSAEEVEGVGVAGRWSL